MVEWLLVLTLCVGGPKGPPDAAVQVKRPEQIAMADVGESQPLLKAGTPATIVCLGDSVTGVYYHTGGRRAYPEMLELAIKAAAPQADVKVINAGVSGQTTVQGLERLDRDVLSHKPDIVTISFGLNDMTRLTEEQFVGNLESLVDRCRKAEAKVVLCTPNAVINTNSRPIEKLTRYCERIRDTGGRLKCSVCDQFAAGEAMRSRDAWEWRLTMSDEIHPNMDGHKRMAEELCRTITGKTVSLSDVGPPADYLAKTKAALKQHRSVKVLAMPPFDALISPALKQLDPAAMADVTIWPTAGKSLAELEQAAKQLVRPQKPDLVILAAPDTAQAEGEDEAFVRSYIWLLNWSLSFGQQDWDCLVVHPAVVAPESKLPRGDLIRRIVKAQHLTLIDRTRGDDSPAEALFRIAIEKAK